MVNKQILQKLLQEIFPFSTRKYAFPCWGVGNTVGNERWVGVVNYTDRDARFNSKTLSGKSVILHNFLRAKSQYHICQAWYKPIKFTSTLR